MVAHLDSMLRHERQKIVEAILIKARSLIDKPQKWCAYWFESDDGRRLGADGAVWRVAGFNTDESRQAIHALAEQSGSNPIWDDPSRVIYLGTHKEVMAMFDKAISEQ